MNTVIQLWPGLRRNSHKLPLPTPTSLTRETMSRLQDQYVVGLKNDGVRHVALLFFDDQTNYVKLLNRKGRETFQRLIQGNEDVWHGTLLDVEVMPDKSWVLLDVMAYGGYSYINESFADRLAKVTDELIQLLATAGITLRRKAWHPLKNIYHLELDDTTDGLIFMPTHLPIRIGRHSNMFKWKPTHTIDLVWINGQFRCMTKQGPQPLEGMEYEGIGNNLVENTVYEFEVMSESKCRLMFARQDKHIPNFITTVQDCIQCTKEKVTLEELRLNVKQQNV